MFQKKSTEKDDNGFRKDRGRFVIDCTRCDGPSTVESRDCLICMCDAVRDASEIDSLMLHSGMDTSFYGESLELIRELASVFSILTMDGGERRGTKCRRCRNSFQRMVADQIQMFPDVNIAVLKERAMQAGVQNEVCELCLGDSARLFDHIGALIEDIRSSARREAE